MAMWTHPWVSGRGTPWCDRWWEAEGKRWLYVGHSAWAQWSRIYSTDPVKIITDLQNIYRHNSNFYHESTRWKLAGGKKKISAHYFISSMACELKKSSHTSVKYINTVIFPSGK